MSERLEKHLKLLGKKCRDKITGYTGIITGKCYHLYGCAQYAINPGLGDDGKLLEVMWFDDGRIEVIGDGINPENVKSDKNGCDSNSMPNMV